MEELDSLNSLKTKFARKYKRTFKKIESCQREEEALAMTNDMYLDLMQRVLKMSGIERGTQLLLRLQEKRQESERSNSSGSDEKSGGNQIDEKIKESIDSVSESLLVLEYQLEEGQYVKQNKSKFKQNRGIINKVPKATNLPLEKVAPVKKREKKLASKTDIELDTEKTMTDLKDGPWGSDEIERFI